MNNNTKIRLRLSKNLFESITREILAEAKKGDMSGGAYTEAVKMPKAKKMEEVNAVADTDRMQKMHKMDEKMSSKEKMAKGLYNEVDVDTDKMKKMEEASKGKPKHDVEALKKAKAKLEQRISEMETMTAEDKIEESVKKKKLKR